MPKINHTPSQTTETTIVLEIRARLASDPDVLIFRNNVGMLTNDKGRKVSFGLAPGSADLIGSLRYGGKHIECTRPLAIEVKKPGQKPSKDQDLWLKVVQKHGWIVGVCHDADEAEALIRQAKAWNL